jgi:hypothetical protein
VYSNFLTEGLQSSMVLTDGKVFLSRIKRNVSANSYSIDVRSNNNQEENYFIVRSLKNAHGLQKVRSLR